MWSRLRVACVALALATACGPAGPPAAAPPARSPSFLPPAPERAAPGPASPEEQLDALAAALPPIPRAGAGASSMAAPTRSSPCASEGGAGDGAVVVERGPLVAFVPAGEAAALAPYLGDLLDRARATLPERYGVSPATPIRVELVADPRAYRERLGGRVPFDVEGAYGAGCVLALSPAGGGGHFGRTVWHELAHAYQDAASAGRVPAWLAEGLAELDARAARHEFRRGREADLAMFSVAPAVGFIARLERAIASPATDREAGAAYHASTELAAYLEARFGEGAIRALLRAYAAGLGAAEALHTATSMRVAELETALVASLAPRLPELVRGRLPALGCEAAASPASEAEELAKRAGCAVLERRLDEARTLADAALASHANEPLALYVRARLAIVDRDPVAVALLRRLVESGHDAYDARIALGRAALAGNDPSAAALDAAAAVALDARRPEGWDLLLRLADRGVPGVDREGAARALVAADPRAVDVTLGLVESAASREDWDTVLRYGEALVYVDPSRPALHEMLARAYDARGDGPRAARERGVLAALRRPGA